MAVSREPNNVAVAYALLHENVLENPRLTQIEKIAVLQTALYNATKPIAEDVKVEMEKVNG